MIKAGDLEGWRAVLTGPAAPSPEVVCKLVVWERNPEFMKVICETGNMANKVFDQPLLMFMIEQDFDQKTKSVNPLYKTHLEMFQTVRYACTQQGSTCG